MVINLEAIEFIAVDNIAAYPTKLFPKETKPFASTPICFTINGDKKKLIPRVIKNVVICENKFIANCLFLFIISAFFCFMFFIYCKSCIAKR